MCEICVISRKHEAVFHLGKQKVQCDVCLSACMRCAGSVFTQNSFMSMLELCVPEWRHLLPGDKQLYSRSSRAILECEVTADQHQQKNKLRDKIVSIYTATMSVNTEILKAKCQTVRTTGCLFCFHL